MAGAPTLFGQVGGVVLGRSVPRVCHGGYCSYWLWSVLGWDGTVRLPTDQPQREGQPPWKRALGLQVRSHSLHTSVLWEYCVSRSNAMDRRSLRSQGVLSSAGRFCTEISAQTLTWIIANLTLAWTARGKTWTDLRGHSFARCVHATCIRSSFRMGIGRFQRQKKPVNFSSALKEILLKFELNVVLLSQRKAFTKSVPFPQRAQGLAQVVT